MQDERYVASADLGSAKIAISVARVEGDDIQIVYYKETPSDGIRHSIVFNPMKASNALKTAISEAETELNIKIKQLVMGLPRCGVHQEIRSAQLLRTDPDSCITPEEIVSLKNMALDNYPLEDIDKEDIYGAVAQSFSADDLINQSEDDIAGIVSDSIEGNFKVFIGSKKAISNISRTANLASVALARQYFVPDAVARAVLNNAEMDNGVALVEIGAGVTSLTIYHGGILRHYSAIPFGGSSITADIKFECGFKDVLAENIKLAYGSAQSEKLQNMSDKIIQINDEENGTYQHLTVRYLSEIIEARAREIIDAVLYTIQESGYADKLRDGVVVTGGGANLLGLSSLFKEMSGYSVRIGYPRVRSFCSSICPGAGETGAAASIGLLLKAKEDKYINCLDEKPRIAEEKEKEAENGSEPDYTDTVFESNSGVIEPNNGKGKPKKQKHPNVFWNKLTKSVSKTANSLFDDTVGNLYDQMGKGNNQ